MSRFFILIILFVYLLNGCDSHRSLVVTPEQAVYESFFLEIARDAHTENYVAGATENDWFVKNPFDKDRWEKELIDLGNIDIELVKELYKVNQNSVLLNWTPIITNTKLLPAKFAGNRYSDFEELPCFVRENEISNGVTKEVDRIRPYYTVSKVAFSADAKTALLKASMNCVLLGGPGEYFVTFKFRDNQWKIAGVWILWIS